MPVVTNAQVADAWKAGKFARNGRGNYTTDGKSLYSYAMLIGITNEAGEKVSLNGYVPYRVSQTTSAHCRLAGRVATRVINPETTGSYGSYVRYCFPRHETATQVV